MDPFCWIGIAVLLPINYRLTVFLFVTLTLYALLFSSFDILFSPRSLYRRIDVEKVSSDQANLESKELAVLSVSLFFACFAIFKLVSARLSTLLRASQCSKVRRTNRGWVLILLSSSMTIFVTLLSG